MKRRRHEEVLHKQVAGVAAEEIEDNTFAFRVADALQGFLKRGAGHGGIKEEKLTPKFIVINNKRSQREVSIVYFLKVA